MDGNLRWQPDEQETWDEEKWEKELRNVANPFTP